MITDQRITLQGYYTKILRWSKLLVIISSAQTLIQGLSLIGGILVLRLLPTQEYALYTLANTMLGTMVILADSGITTSVMAHGGQVWQDKKQLGVVIASGLDLRKKLSIISILVATPILGYLLRNHGASWTTTILITLTLIPTFIATLSGTLLEVAPKLQQDIVALQGNQLKASIYRILALLLILFISPLASLSILAASFSQIWANLKLRKISAGYADYEQKPDVAISKAILAFVKRTAPYSIYYCLSGQITLWLISFFGTTTSIAQVGALGRVTIIISFFTVIFNTLIIPRFAKLNGKDLMRQYILIQISLFAFCLFFIGIVYFFPSPILWVLGKKYANLELELLLSIIGSCVGMIAGISFSLYSNRGWVISSGITIPLNVSAVICAIIFLDVSSLKGILILSILVEAVMAIMNITYCTIKIAKLANVSSIRVHTSS